MDRGLFLYYAYDDGAAEVTFAAAAAADPKFAMAYWGEALADGPDLNTPMTAERFDRGHAAIAHAVALEAGASDRERTYINAMALRYRGAWSDWTADEAAYRNAMLQLAQSQPDDTAKVLAAEALLEDGGFDWKNGRPQNALSQQALSLVKAVLAADPSDVMANHLCLHLYDQAPDRAPAMACAQKLDALSVPAEGEHLAHMPAHYWIETGNYAAAVASSERAFVLFDQLEHVATRDLDHDRYLRHDVYVGYSAAMMLGDCATAKRWSQRMTAAYDRSYDPLTALRFERFSDAYTLATASTAPDLAVRGYAALQLGRVADAHAVAARLRKMSTSGYLTELFLARLAEFDGHNDEANRWIDRAVDEQQRLLGAELIPLLPALEARAGLALRSGAYDKAIAAYQASLTAFPNDPRALFGLAAALHAAGRDDEAAGVRARFDAIWKTTDTTLDANGLL